MSTLTVDLSRLLAAGSFGRKRLLAERAAAAEAVAVRQARVGERPMFRATSPELLSRATALGAEERERGRLVVAGGPAQVRAVTALAAVLAPDAPIDTLLAPDAARVSRLAGRDVTWLVLEGAVWSDALAEHLVTGDHRVLVSGEGAFDAPPGGAWVEDPTECASPLGPTALLVAAFGGVDVAAVRHGAEAAGVVAVRPAIMENPAASLAIALTRAASFLNCGARVHATADAGLLPLARWFEGAWSSAATGLRLGDGPVGCADDTDLVEAIVSGPRDRLVLTWHAPYTALPGAPRVDPADALTDALDEVQIPSLGLRLARRDAWSVGGALGLFGETVAIGAALLGRSGPGGEGEGAWRRAVAARSVDDAVEGQ